MSETTLRRIDGAQEEEGTIEPATELSVLGHLKDRRQKIVEQQTLDLPVPRWDNPVIVVRYKPVDHKVFRAANNAVERVSPDKKSEVEVNVNADILIRACVGVFAVVNGNRYSLREGEPESEWTKFDPELAANLGCEPSARAVVKSLFITEADILSTANRIAEFSGYKEQEADDSILGE